MLPVSNGNRSNVVDAATTYGLDGPGFESRQRQHVFSPPKVQIGSGALFSGAERPGHEVNHPSLSSAEAKNECSHTSTPAVYNSSFQF